MTAGDFDGDGFLDLATAEDSPGGFSVLLGNGDGTFKPQLDYSNSNAPYNGIVSGDFNNDGKLDVALVDNGLVDNGVNVLLGNGDGTFQPAIEYGAADVVSVARGLVADFDGDGNLDLLVFSSDGATKNDEVNVLLGNGDGTFQAAKRTKATLANNFFDMVYQGTAVVGDLNGDGIPDLVSLSTAGVSVLLGKGDGTFYPEILDPGGEGAALLTLGDVNGDGKQDLVATYGYTSNTVSISLGKGDGTFGPTYTYGTVGSTPYASVIADINQDGKPDIVLTANPYGTNELNAVEVLLGNGDGTFQSAVGYLSTLATPSLMIEGDFNGDGRPDLVIGGEGGSATRCLLTVARNRQTTTANVANVSPPVAGAKEVQASYTGDGAFAASSSNVVLAAAFNVSTTTLQFGTLAFGSTAVLPLTITNVALPGTIMVGTTLNDPSYTVLTNAQNTCQAGIAVGQTCTLPIEFSPIAVGDHYDTLTLSPGGGVALITINLLGVATGLGATMEALQFGTIPFGTTEVLPLTISNIQPANDQGFIVYTISGGSFSIVNTAQSTCQGSVAPGESCTLVVQFSPKSVGGHSDILTFYPGGGVAPSTVRLLGTASATGVAPAMNAPLQFGTIPIGSTEVLPLTITNFGVPGTVTIGTATGPSYKILTTSQNTSMAGITAGQSCVLPIQFAPVSVGVKNDILTLTSSSGGATSTVGLMGVSSGVNAGGPLSATPTPLQFGTVPFGTKETLPLTVTNNSVAPGTIFVGATINGPSYAVLTTSQNTCQAGIAAGQSCILPIQFSPVAVGFKDDILILTPNNGGPPSTVSLMGVSSGVGATVDELQFGVLEDYSEQDLQLTIVNNGVPGTITVGTMISGGDSFGILSSTCGGLEAGQTCTLVIGFMPQTAGNMTETLTITPSAGAPPSTVILSGVGQPSG